MIKTLKVVWQTYSPYMSEDHVIRGNAAVLKCHIPSFVADMVTVDHWLVDDLLLRPSQTDWGKVHSFDRNRIEMWREVPR